MSSPKVQQGSILVLCIKLQVALAAASVQEWAVAAVAGVEQASIDQ